MPALGRQETDLYVFESSPAWSTLGVWSTEELPSNTLPKTKQNKKKQANKNQKIRKKIKLTAFIEKIEGHSNK